MKYGMIDLQRLKEDIKREIGGYTETQQEVIKAYIKLVVEALEYEDEQGKKFLGKLMFTTRKRYEKLKELKEKYGLTDADIQSTELMEFNLRGRKLGIQEVSTVHYAIKRIMAGTVNISDFKGEIKDLFSEYRMG